MTISTYDLKVQLLEKYNTGIYAAHNRDRIDYVMRLREQQIQEKNSYEQVVADWLDFHRIPYEWQKAIPLLSGGGKIDHLYLADFVVGKVIIEIDGSSHDKKTKRDHQRDLNTSKLGYFTIRIPTDELKTYGSLYDYLKCLLVEYELINTYVKGPYSKHNFDRIDYVMNIYRKQTHKYDYRRQLIADRVRQLFLCVEDYLPIPIVSKDGKLEHLYLGNIVVGKTIIEVESQWDTPSKIKERDKLTAAQGYKTIRIPTSDLSAETIDSYLKELY